MIGKNLRMKPVAQWTKDVPVVACADKELVYGVELEIEGLNGAQLDIPEGFVLHQDGSLRNNGAEFVTLPMDFSRLAYALDNFFKKGKFTEKNYSERCSVHVHTNVLNLTWEQLQVLVLTYQVFERVLFGFIGNERDRNIFCVPLYDTLMTRNILEGESVDAMKIGMKTWEKYTALNFLPIFQQGSIEFRHMAGTNDVGKILAWCNIIGRLYVFARTTPMEKAKAFFLTLNTTSFYREAMLEVFKEEANLLIQAPGFEENVEAGILVAKWSLLGNRPYKRKRKSGQSLEDIAVNYAAARKWADSNGYKDKEIYIIPMEEFETNRPLKAMTWAYDVNGDQIGVWCWRDPEKILKVNNIQVNWEQPPFPQPEF